MRRRVSCLVESLGPGTWPLAVSGGCQGREGVLANDPTAKNGAPETQLKP